MPESLLKGNQIVNILIRFQIVNLTVHTGCSRLHRVTKRSDSEKMPMTLRTVERALSFLEAVAEAQSAPRLREVAGELGLNITTCYHLLNTLQRRGYISRSGDGTLQVGGRVGLLYQGLQKRLDFGRDLRATVEQLSAATGETAYLSRYIGDGVVIQSVVEATQAVRVTGLHVGFSGSEHVRASGKAVLAFLPDSKRTSVLNCSMGDSTVREYAATIDELAVELDRIRGQGWALDEEKFEEGVCCVAAPYFGSDGSVLGSISVSAPTVRFHQALDKLTEAVREASWEVSAFLGYRAPNGR